MSTANSIPVVVRDIEVATPLIRQFSLARLDGGLLPAFSAGSHVIVRTGSESGAARNAYSLLGPPGDRTRYRIAVRRAETSRGGSRAMHERVGIGTRLDITPPVNLFPLDKRGRRHVLIAAGVGVTPFMAYLHELAASQAAFEMHYAVRSAEHAEYGHRAQAICPQQVRIYLRSNGNRIDPARILADQPLGTHVYVCGPTRLTEETLDAARRAGWPDNRVHVERFASPPGGEAFDVLLARSGMRVHVPPETSLLEALEAAGVEAPSLCRGGACGQCETTVLECDGRLVHHDIFLTQEERAAERKIMPCVSRAVGRLLTLDR